MKKFWAGLVVLVTSVGFFSCLFAHDIGSVSTVNIKPHEEWWEKHYNDPNWLGGMHRASRDLMRKQVIAKGYESILDIPCGYGVDFEGIKAFNINVNYHGMDITSHIVDYCKDRNMPVTRGSIESIPMNDSSIDMTYSRHILEHLDYYEKAISELIRVARKEVFIVFFIVPGQDHDIIKLDTVSGDSIHHNRYNKNKLEEFILANPKVDRLEWAPVDRVESILHIYLKDHAKTSVGERPMVVIIPSYKNACKIPTADRPFYQMNLDSVFSQNYSNYRVIYITDADSMADSDGTGELVEKYIKERGLESRVTLIRNNYRALALKNWYKAILSCDDEEIVVALDGDDMLAHPNVLKRVNDLYSNAQKDIWFTYGNYKFLSSGIIWPYTCAVPEDIVLTGTVRTWDNGPTHLKTFKSWLFKQIKIEDLFHQNDFYVMAPDVAMYTPMLEMAVRNIALTQEMLYVYNDQNPLNEHKVDRTQQWLTDRHIRAKKAYNSLEKSKSGYVDTLRAEQKLRADVIIFAGDDELKTKSFLETLNRKFKNIGRIFVIHEQLTLQEICALSLEDYVLCTTDDVSIDSITCDLEDALYWLETTQAHSFGLSVSRSLLENFASTHAIKIPVTQVTLTHDEPTTVYAWREQKDVKDLFEPLNLILYRKKDLSFIFDHNVKSAESFIRAYREVSRDGLVHLFYNGL